MNLVDLNFAGSKMITTDSQAQFLISKIPGLLNKNKQNLKLLYQGSRDGWRVEEFHKRCDNQGPTLTIIRA
jgi:hypothetical protein